MSPRPSTASILSIAEFLKLGSDPTRASIALALGGEEMSSKELCRAVGLDRSSLVSHMAILRAARVVESRRGSRDFWHTLTGRGRALLGAIESLASTEEPTMNRTDDDEDDGEPRVLAAFPRTHKQTHAPELVRITASPYQGRITTFLWLFFRGVRPSHRDDGWRPTKVGFHFREAELDEAIAALEEIRRMVHAEGRATSDPHREAAIEAEQPRPSDDEADDGYGRPERNERSATPPAKGRSRPRQVQQDAFDEFAEYRK